jgi:hypothetical protein
MAPAALVPFVSSSTWCVNCATFACCAVSHFLRVCNYIIIFKKKRRVVLFQGLHVMSMQEFLAKEASGGGLGPKGLKLPANDTHLWGNGLWDYLSKAADHHPDWGGKASLKQTALVFIFKLKGLCRCCCCFFSFFLFSKYAPPPTPCVHRCLQCRHTSTI